MRTIESHKVNSANAALTIAATDQPGTGGANHRYEITGFHAGTNASIEENEHHIHEKLTIIFQNGPIAECGVNGVTNEALLAIVRDRIGAFNRGSFACDENSRALRGIGEAIDALNSRTKNRTARGVEGTHTV